MHLTYKYRLLTNARQHALLEAMVEGQRQLYNAALEERIAAYRMAGVSLTAYDQMKHLTEWRKADPAAREIPAHLQRGTLLRLDRAFSAFFRRVKAGQKPGFPRFRGKGWFDSLEWAEYAGIRLDGKRLKAKGLGSLCIHFHRPLPDDADIRAVKIVRDAKGWHVCFIVKVAAAPAKVGPTVGIDMGLKDLATLSNGAVIPSLRAGRRAERQLRIAQRSLARKRKGSKGRGRAKQAVSRCHRKVTNQRRNHLHQHSARIADRWAVIGVENLNVTGMAKGHFAKSIHDASWTTFVNMLTYKAERAGGSVVKVSARHTTQECSGCGNRQALGLSERTYRCGACGLHIDRDLNAAKNVKHRAGTGPGPHNVGGYAVRAA